MLDVKIKPFETLLVKELHDVLQLRSKVFVVEQNCIYQDIDGKDPKALHILGYKNKKIVAYTRVFKSGDYFNEASIGRVVVKREERALKYGYEIMEASIHAVKTIYNESIIKVSAQKHLKQFYINLGFLQVGMPYLEDGIPHIAMLHRE